MFIDGNFYIFFILYVLEISKYICECSLNVCFIIDYISKRNFLQDFKMQLVFFKF